MPTTSAEPANVEVYLRRRGFVGVTGPAAAVYLNKMISNNVERLAVGASCEALLLTPKARVIAPMVVYRRADDDFLLLTEPELAEVVIAALIRARFAAKVVIEREQHESYLALGSVPPAVPGSIVLESTHLGTGYEVVGSSPSDGAAVLADDEAERRRIEAGTPLFGHEIDERVLPAEAGLVASSVDFEKGCYPGQEPIARLHYRGHTNRSLRVVRIEGMSVPPFDAEILHADRVVGRVTSATTRETDVVALGYVRNDVPDEAALEVDGARASMIEAKRP